MMLTKGDVYASRNGSDDATYTVWHIRSDSVVLYDDDTGRLRIVGLARLETHYERIGQWTKN